MDWTDVPPTLHLGDSRPRLPPTKVTLLEAEAGLLVGNIELQRGLRSEVTAIVRVFHLGISVQTIHGIAEGTWERGIRLRTLVDESHMLAMKEVESILP